MSTAADNSKPTEVAAPAPTPKKISLRTADGEIFQVEESVAMEFATVRNLLECTDSGHTTVDESTVVPLPNVLANPLAKIIEYCKEQVSFTSDEEKKKSAADFVKQLDKEELKSMILSANYLEVKQLLDLLNQAVADYIQNKSVEFVRAYFGVESDFTPEEEKKMRDENAWAFEGVDQD